MGEKQLMKRYAKIRVNGCESAKKRHFLFSVVCISFFGLYQNPLMFADFPSLFRPPKGVQPSINARN